MHLAAMGHEDVLVVDPDLAGARSSSELNAGGVRATWWRPVNVELCAATIDWFAADPERLGFRQRGYLWLHGPERFSAAAAHVDMQNAFGRGVQLLSPGDVRARWPFIDRVDDLGGATFSPKDGLVSPTAVRDRYREAARAGGVRFRDRAVVTAVRRVGDRVAGVQVRAVGDAAGAGRVLEGGRAGGPAEEIACRRIVNAAGPWASRIAELLGAPVPCQAVPRQVSLLASRDVDLSAQGMIVDSSGVYFHHEGGELVLAGYSPPDDPPAYRWDYEGASFFEREIWPRLAHRISGFDRATHVRGWTGLYELSPDRSALLGAVEGLRNAYEIHSFSGRGVMQSWAAGLCLAELIVLGRYATFPRAEDLAGSRFARGALQPEDLHI